MTNAFRHAVAVLLSFSAALAQPAAAVSLYSGLKAVARPSAPALPGAPVLPVSALQAPSLLPLAQPGAALPPALPALGALEHTAAQLSASPSDGNVPGAPLDAAFDGAGSGSGDSVDRLVSLAKSLFHPTLPAGRQPAVAVALFARTMPEAGIPTDADMQARMALSPLTNPEREAAVIKLYQAGGAAAQVAAVPRGQAPRLDLYDTIQSQDAGRGRNNLIVVKKGRGDRIVVVGAHHDKVSEGAGTIDNWTGSTMLTNLYQAMKDLDTEATFIFAAFAREEEGLIGSEAFLSSLAKAQKSRIDSMLNLDTLAVDGTFSWKNNSTRALLDLIKQVAAREKRDLVEAILNGGDADSSTFKRAGIAAMTMFGASQQVIFDIIHSTRDNMAAFSLPHYRNAYLLALALLQTLDRQPVKKPAKMKPSK